MMVSATTSEGAILGLLLLYGYRMVIRLLEIHVFESGVQVSCNVLSRSV